MPLLPEHSKNLDTIADLAQDLFVSSPEHTPETAWKSALRFLKFTSDVFDAAETLSNGVKVPGVHAEIAKRILEATEKQKDN